MIVTVGLVVIAFLLIFLPRMSAPSLVSSLTPPLPPPTVTLAPLPFVSTPITPSNSSITLLFVGDIMLDRNVAKRTKMAHDPLYLFRKFPSDWLNSADFTVANLEGPVTNIRRPPEKSIDFMFDPSVLLPLKSTGIDAVSQANNHALDQGSLGFNDSSKRLRDAGFLVFGHQVRDDEVAMATTTISGERFAFLGFNTTDNPLDETSALRVLNDARAMNEHVIVFMHWGVEYHHEPIQDQTNRAHWFIDHGADAVIGSHPHWVQGIESYEGRPIIYSLGNFVFDQDFSPETKQGLAVKLHFKNKELVVELIPIQVDQSQPRVVEGEEKQKRLDGIAKFSSPALYDRIVGGWIAF